MSGFPTERRFLLILSLLFIAPALMGNKNFDPGNGLIESDARVEVMRSLCANLKNSYAGWSLKKQIHLSEGYTINPPAKDGPVADGDQICLAAIAQERAIKDPQGNDRIQIATSNNSFRDRVLKLSTSFKDAHFSILPFQTRAEVQLGFSMSKIGAKYLVSSVKAFLNQSLTDSGNPALAIGDEILSLNGETVAAATANLAKYAHSSSERAALKSALDSVTNRKFSYPKTGKVALQYKSQDGAIHTADIHWVYEAKNVDAEQMDRMDDIAYLNSIGAVAKPFAALSDDNERVTIENRASFKGNLSTIEKVRDRTGSIVALGGVYKRMLVIQIRSFMDWYVMDPTAAFGMAGSLDEYFKRWTDGTEASNIPIILDLRDNPGGSPGLVARLLSAFLPAQQTANVMTMALPVTYGNRFTVVDNFLQDQKAMGSLGSMFEAHFGKNLVNRLSADAGKSFISPLFRPKQATSIGIFAKQPKLVLWLSEDCVSACEIAANALSRLPGVITMGSPVNGTGMGMVVSPDQNDLQEVKDSFNMFTSGPMPNMYFGPPSEGMDEDGVSPEQSLNVRISRITENRPLKPMVAYEEQLIDLTQNDLGWLQATEKALGQQEQQ